MNIKRKNRDRKKKFKNIGIFRFFNKIMLQELVPCIKFSFFLSLLLLFLFVFFFRSNTRCSDTIYKTLIQSSHIYTIFIFQFYFYFLFSFFQFYIFIAVYIQYVYIYHFILPLSFDFPIGKWRQEFSRCTYAIIWLLHFPLNACLVVSFDFAYFLWFQLIYYFYSFYL